MKMFKKIRAIIITCFLGMVIALCSYTASVHAESSSVGKLNNGTENILTKHLRVKVTFGYNGYVKYGDNMPVRAEIYNKSSSSYKGIFRIVYRNNEKIPMIQKKFSVKKHSNIRININVPVMFFTERYTIVICDENGNDITYKDVECDVSDTKLGIYTGIISDKPSDLKYIENMFTEDEKNSSENGVVGRVFDIKEKDLKSVEKLSSLDLIIIDNYDTDRLSDDMVDNLRKWVYNGGTLLLGAEEKSDGINVKLNSNKKNSVSINVNPLKIKNSTVVLEKSGIPLICKVDKGQGNVMMSGFSLSIPKEIWPTFGYTILKRVNENFSDVKKFRIKNGDFSIHTGDSAFAYRFDALKINPDDELPNLKLYGIILVIYIILAGPLMFIYYKKKGKTARLWVMVPILAFVFSFIIYILGTSTRIQKPFINYLSQIQLGISEKEHSADTLFSITNVSNDKYTVPVKRKCDIVPANLSIYSDTPRKYKKIFDYGVDCTNDKNELVINRMSSFERAGFYAKHKTEVKGNVDIDISKDDIKIKGSVTNRLSCDLKNCVIYYSGNLVKMGDMAAGETKYIDKISSDFYMAKDYDYDMEKQINDAMGINLYDTSFDSSKRRKCGLFEAYLSEDELDSPFFYGYIENEHNGFSKMFELNSYGETGVCKRFDIKQ